MTQREITRLRVINQTIVANREQKNYCHFVDRQAAYYIL